MGWICINDNWICFNESENLMFKYGELSNNGLNIIEFAEIILKIELFEIEKEILEQLAKGIHVRKSKTRANCEEIYRQYLSYKKSN